jgi:hypothetical protein
MPTFKRFLEKSFAKMRSLCLHKRTKKPYFLAPQDPKNTVKREFIVGFTRLPSQSSPKMSTPLASKETPHLLACG